MSKQILAPTRRDLIRILDRLLKGEECRVGVASWAITVLENQAAQLDDFAVLTALKRIGAVDLPAPDRDFLYNESDFQSWKLDLLRK